MDKSQNNMENITKTFAQIARSIKPFEELSPEEKEQELRIMKYSLDKHFEIKQLEKITELKQITENNMKAAGKQFWASIIISLTALVISGFFAIRSELAFTKWQEDQLKILKQQEQVLNNINIQIGTLIKDLKNKPEKEIKPQEPTKNVEGQGNG